MESDFEIVKSRCLANRKIAEITGIKSEHLELYGKYKAKIDLSILKIQIIIQMVTDSYNCNESNAIWGRQDPYHN